MTDPLAKLLGSAARLKLLRLFLFNPSTVFAADEAASRARVPLDSAKRELALFQRIRLLKQVPGKERRYIVRTDFKHLAALQTFLLSASVGGEEVIKQLRGAGNIKFIALSGVFVGDWEAALDLLVAGDNIAERRLNDSIARLEAELGRELRYAFLPSTEFSYRVAMSDKLVRDVLDYSHRVVLDRLNTGLA